MEKRKLDMFSLELDLMEKWYNCMIKIEGVVERLDKKISSLDQMCREENPHE